MLLREYVRLLLIEQASAPKVIFMAGAPGSGKSYAIKRLGLTGKIDIINPDDQYEKDMKQEGIPMDRAALFAEYQPLKKRFLAAQEAGDKEAIIALEPEYQRVRSLISRNMELFSKARKAAKSMKDKMSAERKTFLVDGTGGNFNEINKQNNKFRDLGYETGMIFVDVPVELSIERDLMRSRKGKRSLGSDVVIRSWNSVNNNLERYRELFGQNFFRINAELDGFDQSISENRPRLESFLGLI